MVSEQLEVERKFDVDPGFVLPDLTGLPGVAAVAAPVVHELTAVYLDTEDLRLARARITLRRRTGGPDEGWHLKLPAGAARRELHAPLGDPGEGPPEELRRSVARLVGPADLAPVVTLRTRRVVTALLDGDGGDLAEIADDAVRSATTGQRPEMQEWREVEVELVTGEEALLEAAGERLVAAGARPSPRVSKLATALGDRLRG
ncbi:hypothetical protein DQ237_16805 [Blastococcus sp. TF02-8]|uniref:CYTH domain-containing protein n=1 Tax=Blastococcus sp. TF02-8 TaxID=2250574 RepID=UPI000DE800CA|nr:CYTH domain-containing protein [Blastococcus sp. TF02-8]RBY93638.1 hypothetical protein DQ237_16805 [Blastococcus sp. TF02-8]